MFIAPGDIDFSLYFITENNSENQKGGGIGFLHPLQNPDSRVLKQHFLTLEEVYTVPQKI